MKRKLSSVLGAVLVGGGVNAAEMPKVGDAAPDFTATASDGSTVRLKDYLGKSNVVLYFYPKDDTPGCTKEACGVRDDYAEFAKLNAVVFGVSYDSVESHKKFTAKYNLPFLLLADTDRKIAEAYGAGSKLLPVAKRVTFVIDRQGKIAYVNPKVSPAAHSAEIRDVLAKLPR
jgi:peroxiredoxin Q/BCP